MTIPPAPRKASFHEFVILMAIMISLIAMSIDAMLPALGQLGADFGVEEENRRQFVVTVLFAGMAFGQILFGPWSESVGRKKAVYVGLGFFLTGSLLAMLAPDFQVLLAARFLQGFGGAAGQIIAMAMIRDRYEGREMARVLSLVLGVFILVPAIAPTIGQGILFIGSWRTIFAFLTVQGLVTLVLLRFRAEETLPPENRRAFTPGIVLDGVRQVVTTPVTVGYTLCAGCVFGGIISYVNSAQQVFQGLYETGTMFPLFFGMIALSIGVASFVNSTLVRKLGMRRQIATGLCGIVVLTGLFLCFQLMVPGRPPLALFMVFAMATFFCFGMLFGNLNAMAMEPMGHIAGLAAAVISCLSMVISVSVGTIIGQAYNGTVLPLTLGLFCLAAGAGAIMFATEKLGQSRLQGPQPAARD